MINNNFEHEAHFTLSYQLLCLFRWLIEHDEERLKKLINKALSDGLFNDIRKKQPNTELSPDAQNSILDFFATIETMLAESINERIEQQAREKNLLPSIDHIDTSICTQDLVRSSLDKIASKMDINSKESPQEMLFRELLKRWKPINKNMLN
jgi:hypothetical protein